MHEHQQFAFIASILDAHLFNATKTPNSFICDAFSLNYYANRLAANDFV